MKSVPPRCSGWVLNAEAHATAQFVLPEVNLARQWRTHPLPRGGTDFMTLEPEFSSSGF
jgi:hypothetical protein